MCVMYKIMRIVFPTKWVCKIENAYRGMYPITNNNRRVIRIMYRELKYHVKVKLGLRNPVPY